MKELSTEEKAKRYDEVLEKAKNWYVDAQIYFKKSLELLFPELKESENERIREAIISYITCGQHNGVSNKDMIAWLEKQGEQPQGKSALEAAKEEKVDNQNCVKPANKIEPKFHKGDWVIDKQGIVHQIANVVENVTLHTYGYDIVGGGYFNDDTEGVRLWTLEDVKNGDVLDVNGATFIYKKHDECYVYFYCGVTLADDFIEPNPKNDTWSCIYKVCPATEEQRDILFARMKEEGYEWDNSDKKLKKIKQKSSDSYCREHCIGYQETGKCFADGDCDAKREADSKQWSEEVEGGITGLNAIVA